MPTPPGRQLVSSGLLRRVNATQLQQRWLYVITIGHQKTVRQTGIAECEGEIEVAFARDAKFPHPRSETFIRETVAVETDHGGKGQLGLNAVSWAENNKVR